MVAIRKSFRHCGCIFNGLVLLARYLQYADNPLDFRESFEIDTVSNQMINDKELYLRFRISLAEC